MGKYRRRIEIVADILDVARAGGGGAKKTKIMYAANLSFRLLQKYLGETVEVGLMRFNNAGYEVTDKGRMFLERFGQFSSKYSRIEKDLDALKFEIEILERMCKRAIDAAPNNSGRKQRAVLS